MVFAKDTPLKVEAEVVKVRFLLTVALGKKPGPATPAVILRESVRQGCEALVPQRSDAARQDGVLLQIRTALLGQKALKGLDVVVKILELRHMADAGQLHQLRLGNGLGGGFA